MVLNDDLVKARIKNKVQEVIDFAHENGYGLDVNWNPPSQKAIIVLFPLGAPKEKGVPKPEVEGRPYPDLE